MNGEPGDPVGAGIGQVEDSGFCLSLRGKRRRLSRPEGYHKDIAKISQRYNEDTEDTVRIPLRNRCKNKNKYKYKNKYKIKYKIK